MKQLVQQLVGSIRRLLTQPLGELNRWQLTARYAVGIARYGANELKEDRASQMAAKMNSARSSPTWTKALSPAHAGHGAHRIPQRWKDPP